MAKYKHFLASFTLLFALPSAQGVPQDQIPLHLPASQPSTLDPPLPLHLNFSSPAPHLFHSTLSLLQQLPNTVFPNGHSLVPVEISAYTLFFHARRDAEAPDSPEWVAFDSDMSYGIMGGHRNVWMWTYQTTRRVKAIYFDGESGNLQGLGQFDFQMLLLYGNVTGPPGMDDLKLEYARAQGLCDWLAEAGLRGKGWGFEGVVRMNAGFEMIWCDFASDSMKLVSRIDVTAPQLPRGDDFVADTESEDLEADRVFPDKTLPESMDNAVASRRPTSTPNLPPGPPNWRDELRREPFLRTRSWGWFESATWHYGSSGMGFNTGESRAKVLSCRTLSFYSREFLNQSLNRVADERERLNLTETGRWKGPGTDGARASALTELRRRRRFHHLEHASKQEASNMRNNIELALRKILEGDDCSGADWVLMMSNIVQRNSKLLANFETALYSEPQNWGNATSIRQWLQELRGLSHLFMVNHLQYPQGHDPSVWVFESRLFNETYALCRDRYTSLLNEQALDPEEAEQKWAMEETLGSLCMVQLSVGFDIEQTWEQMVGTGDVKLSESLQSLRNKSQAWGDQVSELRAWLGWESENIACKDVCSAEERCYIPMWPITRPERNPEDDDSEDYYIYHRSLLQELDPTRSTSNSARTSRRPWRHTEEIDLWEPKCVKDVCIEGLCWI